MSGVAITIDPRDLDRLADRLQRWARGQDLDGVLDAIGAEVESQTRRRLEDERTSPDGDEWPQWSERYAATRHGGHALLQNEGDLVDSIAYVVGRGAVEVGSPLIYAATHQFGDRGIPPRPFLGLSEDDAADVLDVVTDWIDAQFRRF